MAKKIVRKSTKKNVQISEIIDGVEVIAKTTRNCAGNTKLAVIEKDARCVKCQATNSKVAQICKAKALKAEPAATRSNKIEGETRIEARINKNGKWQNKVVGKRGDKNAWGHHEGTIGFVIDELILLGRFNRKEIAEMASTKLSKVNSHIAHLGRDKGIEIIAPRGGVVSVA